MVTEICKCNNCERLLIDENPQIGTEKVEIENIRVHTMVWIEEENDSFWACPHCLTDDYLTDKF